MGDLGDLYERVNHPKHYNLGVVETIDFIESCLTGEEFRGYVKGNLLKYISREKLKNGQEDLEKAEWYLKRLLTVKERKEHVNTVEKSTRVNLEQSGILDANWPYRNEHPLLGYDNKTMIKIEEIIKKHLYPSPMTLKEVLSKIEEVLRNN